MFEHLKNLGADDALSELIVSIADSCKEISEVIAGTDTGKAGTINSYGEEQITMDVQAENIMERHLRACPFVFAFGSEEIAGLQDANEEGQFSIFFDPLDGSSLVDVNFAFGTIAGIYQAKKVIGLTPRDQLAAVYAIYGPRTTFVVAVNGVVSEFVLRSGEWILNEANLKVGEKKYFAPGNLRACDERLDYLDLVMGFVKEKYTLRYSGGMVPDINHILKKGGGVFMYPGMPSAPQGKLRLMFECGPMAMIVETAGGASSNGEKSILDIEIADLEARTPIFVGSKSEVQKCEENLK